MTKFAQLIKDEDGQSLVEYGLILGLVSVALITVLGTMKQELGKIFTAVANSLKSAAAQVKGGK